MKLYYSPGACSIGIHLLLEEIGAPYELHKVSLQTGEQYKPEFTAINPKSKVPTLVRDDGSVLTEYAAIATWLARAFPAAKLLPADIEGEARINELVSFCTGTLQREGFGRIFRAVNFATNPADHPAVNERGREIIQKCYGLLDQALQGREYAWGDHFTIADSALFFVEMWSEPARVALPPHCSAHLARIKARPAAIRVLRDEGLTGK